MGNLPEQHVSRSGRYITPFPVKPDRRFPSVHYDTCCPQQACPGFQGFEDKGADSAALVVCSYCHVADLTFTDRVEMQPPHAQRFMCAIHGHDMRAAFVQGVPFTAGWLAPGGAQDFPAQPVILAQLAWTGRLDDSDPGQGRRQAKTTQVVAMYFTPACRVTPRCSCVQKGGNRSNLPASGLIRIS